MDKKKKQITIVCGPTSTGKSDFAFNLAIQSQPSLIVSADSRQFYKGISVISGQDTKANLPKNCLLVGQNFLNPDEEFSISQFRNFFLTQLKIFPNRHIFVVGGSGLYLKAITENLETISIPPNHNLRQELEKLSLPGLQKKLSTADPKKFNNLNNSDINNPRRLIRAIEIAMSGIKTTKPKQSTNLNFTWIALKDSFKNLETKIETRVNDRIKNGAISEVQSLLEEYKDQSLPVYSTLGVREIISYLNKEISLEVLVSKWTSAELQYAKRQMTWFRKQPQIVWYDKGI